MNIQNEKRLQKRNCTGTFIAIFFTPETQEKIYHMAKNLNIPNLLSPEQLHTTISCSETTIKDFPVFEDIYGKKINDSSLIIDFWKLSGGNLACVAKYKSSFLEKRHQLANSLGGTNNFKKYQPHITLSYSVPENFKILDNIIDLDIFSKEEVMKEVSPKLVF